MEGLEQLATGPRSTHAFVLRNKNFPDWLDTPLSTDTPVNDACGTTSEYIRYPNYKVQEKPRGGRRTDGYFWWDREAIHHSERFWPWIAQISIAERPYEVACTGSIIGKKWILTAASCMVNRWPLRYPAPDEVHVRAKLLTKNIEVNHWEGQPQELLVEEIIPHERFNISTFFNDIALLRLKEEITYEKHIRPTCLPPAKGNIGADSKLYKEDELAISVGWDTVRVKSLKPSTEHLRQQEYTIGSEMDCLIEPHGEIYAFKGIICGKSYNGSACVARGGGPLMQSTHDEQLVWTQVGIWSWGPVYCTQNSSDYFTDVSYYVPWIRSYVDAGAVIKAPETVDHGASATAHWPS
ncbi:chymotrypsinogen B-like [Haemaphysalis longicornis]